MTRYVVEVLRPTPLLPQGGDDRGAFENGWRHVPIAPGKWRANGRLRTGDETFFVKGLRIPLIRKKQRWRQRWDIEHEASMLRRLREQGLHVPRVVTWGTERRAGIPLRSFLIAECYEESCSLAEWIEELADVTAAPDDEQAEVLRSAGSTLEELHALGLAHGDLAVRNILVHPAGSPVRTSLIDVPRVRSVDGSGRLERVDRYRLVKTALKQGLSPKWAQLLLDPCSDDHGPQFVADVQRIRAIKSRVPRMAMYQLWLRQSRKQRRAAPIV